MRVSTFLIAVLAAIILTISALLAVGCGGGGDSSSSAAKTDSQQAAQTSTGESQQSGAEAGEPESSSEAEGPKGGEAKAGEAEAGEPKAGTEAGGASPAKTAFIEKGDAICGLIPNEYNSRLQSLEKEKKAANEPKATPQEIAAEASVPPLKGAVAKLKLLSPPPGDEQEIAAIIGSLEAAAEGLEKSPTAEFSGPKSPFGKFQKLTGEYGFTTCNRL